MMLKQIKSRIEGGQRDVRGVVCGGYFVTAPRIVLMRGGKSYELRADQCLHAWVQKNDKEQVCACTASCRRGAAGMIEIYDSGCDTREGGVR